MIESEIAILNLVSHPNIIELIEVFDFPDEKYLVSFMKSLLWTREMKYVERSLFIEIYCL